VALSNIAKVGLAAEIESYAKAHGPLTIGLAGAGQMGTDIVVEISQMTGVRLGAISEVVIDAARAAAAAAYLHGLAGDVAAETMGEHSLVATDLLAGLPEAFRRATRWAGESVVRISG